MSFSRAARLTRPSEFNAVRHGPCRLHDTFFVLNAVRRTGAARIGIAVSRRVSPNAVTRNRIKRQIRESFRLHRATLPGIDIVVVARAAAAAAENRRLAASLRNHWKRLVRQCKEC